MELNIGKINQKIAAIAKKHNLKFVVLFGSAATRTTKDSSDIDVAVLRKDGARLTYEPFLNISNDLSDKMDAGLQRIDLVDLTKANILLRYEITRGGVLLYGDEETYEDYRLFAFKDYIDGRRLRELENLFIQKRQKFLANKLNV